MKKPLIIVGGLVGLAALAMVAVIAIQLLRSDDPNLRTEAPLIETPTPGVGRAATATPENDAPAETTAASAVADLPDGVRQFVIISEESEAKYVVRESLRGIKTNAVGTTSAVTGSIFLTSEGLYDGMSASFQVDLSTLESDESMRDNYIKRNTLQTSQYPLAEFVIEQVTGFPTDYVENSEVQLTLSGTLTIRDISQPVTWSVLARQAGDTLTATADLFITFQDFGMSPPSVTIAQAEDEIQIQVVLIAREPA